MAYSYHAYTLRVDICTTLHGDVGVLHRYNDQARPYTMAHPGLGTECE